MRPDSLSRAPSTSVEASADGANVFLVLIPACERLQANARRLRTRPCNEEILPCAARDLQYDSRHRPERDFASGCGNMTGVKNGANPRCDRTLVM
jgi:hypothetical protein